MLSHLKPAVAEDAGSAEDGWAQMFVNKTTGEVRAKPPPSTEVVTKSEDIGGTLEKVKAQLQNLQQRKPAWKTIPVSGGDGALVYYNLSTEQVSEKKPNDLIKFDIEKDAPMARISALQTEHQARMQAATQGKRSATIGGKAGPAYPAKLTHLVVKLVIRTSRVSRPFGRLARNTKRHRNYPRKRRQLLPKGSGAPWRNTWMSCSLPLARQRR